MLEIKGEPNHIQLSKQSTKIDSILMITIWALFMNCFMKLQNIYEPLFCKISKSDASLLDIIELVNP